MKIVPSVGMAIIKEDKKDFADASIDIPDQAIRGIGTQGVILFVSNLSDIDPLLYFESLQNRCPWVNSSSLLDPQQRTDLENFCKAMERGREKANQWKEGDHVVFSKFNEQICIYENGKEEIYYSVPVQSILGLLLDA